MKKSGSTCRGRENAVLQRSLLKKRLSKEREGAVLAKLERNVPGKGGGHRRGIADLGTRISRALEEQVRIRLRQLKRHCRA